MRPLVCALALLLAFAQGAAAERMVTDSAGREVAVPDRIERVFAAGPPASILLYILAPDRMIGWPRAPDPEELPYIAPDYRDLPEVGWLTGRGDPVNLEVLLHSRPNLVFDFGLVRDTCGSLAERVRAIAPARWPRSRRSASRISPWPTTPGSAVASVSSG